MIRATNLAQRLANILAARGKSADFLNDCRCVDDSDDQPPRLEHWDAVKLGPEPTQAEVDAAAVTPTPTQQRLSVDETERQACVIDAQILADLNMTTADVNSTVDTVFAGFTAAQRTFLKRLVRMVIAAARKVLRNGPSA